MRITASEMLETFGIPPTAGAVRVASLMKCLNLENRRVPQGEAAAEDGSARAPLLHYSTINSNRVKF
jgi:hypothetical protein